LVVDGALLGLLRIVRHLLGVHVDQRLGALDMVDLEGIERGLQFPARGVVQGDRFGQLDAGLGREIVDVGQGRGFDDRLDHGFIGSGNLCDLGRFFLCRLVLRLRLDCGFFLGRRLDFLLVELVEEGWFGSGRRRFCADRGRRFSGRRRDNGSSRVRLDRSCRFYGDGVG
jgi:hypothetical protein